MQDGLITSYSYGVGRVKDILRDNVIPIEFKDSFIDFEALSYPDSGKILIPKIVGIYQNTKINPGKLPGDIESFLSNFMNLATDIALDSQFEENIFGFSNNPEINLNRNLINVLFNPIYFSLDDFDKLKGFNSRVKFSCFKNHPDFYLKDTSSPFEDFFYNYRLYKKEDNFNAFVGLEKSVKEYLDLNKQYGFTRNEIVFLDSFLKSVNQFKKNKTAWEKFVKS
jgi:hypothetical protein